jgi:HK97 gp10 family phage protein
MTGFDTMQKEIKESVSKEKISKALLESVHIVEREAKIRCPVQFGNLRDSITHNKISDLTYELGAYADYADYIEFGTMHINVGTEDNPLIYTSSPPGSKFPSYRPFLRSALYSKMNEIEQIFDNMMGKK